jgi:saccharopine dehydrogenase-like NADP-dependent oxidoreductase
MKEKTVIQLGYGMQGKAALFDLARSGTVDRIIVADASPGLAEEVGKMGYEKVSAVTIDASDPSAVLDLIKGSDVVVELLPGFLAFQTAKAAVEAGVSLVSSMYLTNPGEQDPDKNKERRKELEELDQEGRRKGITILQEFGMDPGIDLVLGNRALKELDEVQVFHSYGAGFPELASAGNPLRYKFTWSIIGVMRSYLRPARIFKNGSVVEIPADRMFSPENTHILDLPEMGGPLECFPNGDSEHFAEVFGLREKIRAMGRYICRWPGHGAFWETMARSGFLGEEPVKCGDSEMSPAAFCASLLGSQKQFFYAEDEKDVALIRADVRGMRKGKPTRVIWQIVDRRDLETGFSAMQRTVGFPVSIGAQMILDGRISQKGVVDPTQVPFEPYMKELESRGFKATRLEEEWNGDLKA